MSFRVGQNVLCVDDSEPAHSAGIRRGSTYEVSRLRGTFLCITATDSLLWLHGRFEPAPDASTDIRALTELLNPLNHKPLPEITPLKERVDIGT